MLNLLRAGMSAVNPARFAAVANAANFTPASSHHLSAGDNFTLGSNEFAFSGWFKCESFAQNPCFVGKYNTGGGNASWYFYYDDTNTELKLGISENGNNQTYTGTVAFTATVDIWYHFVVTRVVNTLHTYIDGVDLGTNDMTGVTPFTVTTACTWGGLGPLNNLFLDGSLYGCAAVVGDHFDTTDVSNLYGSGPTQVTCYENLPTATKNKIDSYWRMGNYDTNAGSELTDLAGAINLTNPNSAPFTGSGLSVEC